MDCCMVLWCGMFLDLLLGTVEGISRGDEWCEECMNKPELCHTERSCGGGTKGIKGKCSWPFPICNSWNQQNAGAKQREWCLVQRHFPYLYRSKSCTGLKGRTNTAIHMFPRSNTSGSCHLKVSSPCMIKLHYSTPSHLLAFNLDVLILPFFTYLWNFDILL